ncbi:MAG TPA: ABC transporter ATP-binding protein [Candidatus Acidoferrales bacterium]|nr:ABC transporter ATP-binding protein [Candidatus Acidoferrales bacterium]
MSEPAIDTRNLRKVFGERVAVQSLTLEVGRGEVFGFLGPNGAGKSTSIKMLLGLVRPTSGEAQVLGRPAGKAEARRRVGFLPEHFRFYDWLTPVELLEAHGRLAGMERTRLEERIPRLLQMVGLGPHRDRRLGAFSKGMLQRIGLAQALVNEPELVFLDEPTSGLDPLGRRLVRDIVHEECARGTTVFLNSHLLGEVELTCDRVAFLKSGEVVAMRELRTGSETRVEARVGGLTRESLDGLGRWAREVRTEGERLTFEARRQDLPEIVRYLAAQGAEVYQLTPRRTSLEEMFLDIVGEDGGL